MLGNFNPSVIVDEIYNILEDYEIQVDTYKHEVVYAIIDYFTNNLHIEYLLNCCDWPNEEGGICAIAFIDNGHPQLVTFDYMF